MTSECGHNLRILLIEPYFGGSHAQFCQGLMASSRHDVRLVDGPAHHWKWQMRGAPLAMRGSIANQDSVDLVLASDFADLATMVGLCPSVLGTAAKVVYFHENQFSYPDPRRDQRDVHFGLIHINAIAVADAAWFNSAWHLESFWADAEASLGAIRGCDRNAVLEQIRPKLAVLPLGVDLPGEPETASSESGSVREPGPLRIVWNHRWEHDKNPEGFWRILCRLRDQQVDFELILLGEVFQNRPPVWTDIHECFPERILHSGYVESRRQYEELLAKGDVVVSTSDHEFFGVSVVEAMAAGCLPLLPWRLSYPELIPIEYYDRHLYRSDEELIDRLQQWASRPELLAKSPELVRAARRFGWEERSAKFDRAFERLITMRQQSPERKKEL